VLAAYCHGCDRADEVMMAGTYCAESWDDHGPRKMDGKRFSHETVEESIATTTLVSHQLGQSLIRVNGDKAGAETYFIATLLYPPKDGRQNLNQLGGRYVDWLAREDGAWKISKRICVREWSVSQPIAGDWLRTAGFAETRRGPTDPSWEALGISHQGSLWNEALAAE
jgi:hypothetical protein